MTIKTKRVNISWQSSLSRDENSFVRLSKDVRALLRPLAFIIAASAFCIGLCSEESTAQTKRRRSSTASADSPRRAPISIAVLPFRNSLRRRSADKELEPRRSDDDETTVLGDGIADSLANALKSVAGLAVVDMDIVWKAAEEFPEVDMGGKDSDALLVGSKLAAQIIVAGSFHRFGNQIRIDARILVVDTSKSLPAQAINVTGVYPDAYSNTLNELAIKMLTRLRVPLSRLETEYVREAFESTRSPKAYQMYDRGVRQARAGGEDGLSKAIQLFTEALKIDPRCSIAFAARAEARVRLAEIKRAACEDTRSLIEAALTDATEAINAAPNLGRGHVALADVNTASGNYDAAAVAAQRATRLWPSDAGAYLGLSKALGRGEFVRNQAMDRALRLQPGLALLLPQLPKLLVENKSDYALNVQFVPRSGPRYPDYRVAPGSTRVVALFPGEYRVVVQSQIGSLEEQHTFEADKDYKLTYTATTFPIATFTFENDCEVPVTIRVSGPTTTYLVIGPQGSKTVEVAPGKYLVVARARGLTKSDWYALEAGDEESITYRLIRTVRD